MRTDQGALKQRLTSLWQAQRYRKRYLNARLTPFQHHLSTHSIQPKHTKVHFRTHWHKPLILQRGAIGFNLALLYPNDATTNFSNRVFSVMNQYHGAIFRQFL